MKVTLLIHSETDTERLGRALARHLPAFCVVSLDGTLGAGKTHLVRAFSVACEVPAKQVTSPTFTLWQTYQGNRTIHHLDAYRIHDEDEFDALGLSECFDTESIIFVEWAERVATCLPKFAHLAIGIEVISESERHISLVATDETLTDPLHKIAKAMQR